MYICMYISIWMLTFPFLIIISYVLKPVNIGCYIKHCVSDGLEGFPRVKLLVTVSPFHATVSAFILSCADDISNELLSTLAKLKKVEKKSMYLKQGLGDRGKDLSASKKGRSIAASSPSLHAQPLSKDSLLPGIFGNRSLPKAAGTADSRANPSSSSSVSTTSNAAAATVDVPRGKHALLQPGVKRKSLGKSAGVRFRTDGLAGPQEDKRQSGDLITESFATPVSEMRDMGRTTRSSPEASRFGAGKETISNDSEDSEEFFSFDEEGESDGDKRAVKTETSECLNFRNIVDLSAMVKMDGFGIMFVNSETQAHVFEVGVSNFYLDEVIVCSNYMALKASIQALFIRPHGINDHSKFLLSTAADQKLMTLAVTNVENTVPGFVSHFNSINTDVSVNFGILNLHLELDHLKTLTSYIVQLQSVLSPKKPPTPTGSETASLTKTEENIRDHSSSGPPDNQTSNKSKAMRYASEMLWSGGADDTEEDGLNSEMGEEANTEVQGEGVEEECPWDQSEILESKQLSPRVMRKAGLADAHDISESSLTRGERPKRSKPSLSIRFELSFGGLLVSLGHRDTSFLELALENLSIFFSRNQQGDTHTGVHLNLIRALELPSHRHIISVLGDSVLQLDFKAPKKGSPSLVVQVATLRVMLLMYVIKTLDNFAQHIGEPFKALKQNNADSNVPALPSGEKNSRDDNNEDTDSIAKASAATVTANSSTTPTAIQDAGDPPVLRRASGEDSMSASEFQVEDIKQPGFIHLDVDIGAPIIVLPESDEPDCSFFEFQFGRVKLSNAYTSDSTYPDCYLDEIKLSIDELQLVVMKGGQKNRNIIQPSNLQLHLLRRLTSDFPQVPQFKGHVAFESLRLTVRDMDITQLAKTLKENMEKPAVFAPPPSSFTEKNFKTMEEEEGSGMVESTSTITNYGNLIFSAELVLFGLVLQQQDRPISELKVSSLSAQYRADLDGCAHVEVTLQGFDLEDVRRDQAIMTKFPMLFMKDADSPKDMQLVTLKLAMLPHHTALSIQVAPLCATLCLDFVFAFLGVFDGVMKSLQRASSISDKEGITDSPSETSESLILQTGMGSTAGASTSSAPALEGNPPDKSVSPADRRPLQSPSQRSRQYREAEQSTESNVLIVTAALAGLQVKLLENLLKYLNGCIGLL